MIQGGFDLPSVYAGEPRQKLLYSCSITEVLKEGRDRHARAAKNPDPAKFVGVSFNGLTRFPVFHVNISLSQRFTIQGRVKNCRLTGRSECPRPRPDQPRRSRIHNVSVRPPNNLFQSLERAFFKRLDMSYVCSINDGHEVSMLFHSAAAPTSRLQVATWGIELAQYSRRRSALASAVVGVLGDSG